MIRSPRMTPTLLSMLASSGLHRRVVVCQRVRSEDRSNIASGETPERGGVTKRPINPVDAMQPGELHGVGHLHPHLRRTGGCSLNKPHPGAIPERQELGLSDVGWFGLTGRRPGGPAGRGG